MVESTALRLRLGASSVGDIGVELLRQQLEYGYSKLFDDQVSFLSGKKLLSYWVGKEF